MTGFSSQAEEFRMQIHAEERPREHKRERESSARQGQRPQSEIDPADLSLPAPRAVRK